MGRFRRNSSVLRSPDLVIASRLKFRTGFGPTSSAVGIFEPVTIMRSAVACPGGGCTGVPGATPAAPGTPTADVHPATCATVRETNITDNARLTMRAALQSP